MHASFHFIIQILQLAYTAQACIINLKLMQCKQAHMNKHISNANNQVYELAPPTCVLQILIDLLPLPFHLFAPPILLSL